MTTSLWEVMEQGFVAGRRTPARQRRRHGATDRADGQSWRQLGAAKGRVAGADVLELHVPLAAGAPSRRVRARIPARGAGEKLSLVEAEVWGK